MKETKRNSVMVWDLNKIRDNIKKLIGKKVTLEAYSSKKTCYKKECMVEMASSRVFTVKMLDTGLYKSFSYRDIVDGSVKLENK